jgi:hypothetical protein
MAPMPLCPLFEVLKYQSLVLGVAHNETTTVVREVQVIGTAPALITVLSQGQEIITFFPGNPVIPGDPVTQNTI